MKPRQPISGANSSKASALTDKKSAVKFAIFNLFCRLGEVFNFTLNQIVSKSGVGEV
jgi:hypothetical protein